MSIVVTGSIAYDYLMSFPGKFTEHLLPEHVHRVSLSFLVDTMDKRRGGCAPNIAYTLALLGERPRLMGTAGQDFGDYRHWLEAAGIDTSLVGEVPDKFTASFFCSTDQDSNQIASFYTGAMANAAELSFRTAGTVTLTIISPNDPQAMLQYAEECRTLDDSLHLRPRSTVREDVRTGACRCAQRRDGADPERLRARAAAAEDRPRRGELSLAPETLVVTRGEEGSTILTADREIRVPAVDAASHRRSHRRRRRVSRRLHEGHGAGTATSRRRDAWGASPPPTRSSISAARATPTPGPNSRPAMRSISGRLAVRPRT